MFNARNYGYAHHETADLILQKLADRVSPSNRCFICNEFKFLRWDLVHDEMNDDTGSGSGSEQMNSEAFFASTLNLGNVPYKAVDIILLYAPSLVIDPTVRFPEPGLTWPLVALTLIELGGNPGRQLGDSELTTELNTSLIGAKMEVGEQAGFMFGNLVFQRQPYVIGIAMVAEYWSYAVFHQDQRPVDFDETEVWELPVEDWSPPVFWGTIQSDIDMFWLQQQTVDLLAEMGIPLI